MSRQVNMQGTKIKQGGRKILLHFVGRPAFAFYSADQRTAVITRNLESFH
jgi:hypothetical protein